MRQSRQRRLLEDLGSASDARLAFLRRPPAATAKPEQLWSWLAGVREVLAVDPEAPLRREAAIALGGTAVGDWLISRVNELALEHVLADPHPHVREAARQALIQQRKMQAVTAGRPWLQRLLSGVRGHSKLLVAGLGALGLIILLATPAFGELLHAAQAAAPKLTSADDDPLYDLFLFVMSDWFWPVVFLCSILLTVMGLLQFRPDLFDRSIGRIFDLPGFICQAVGRMWWRWWTGTEPPDPLEERSRDLQLLIGDSTEKRMKFMQKGPSGRDYAGRRELVREILSADSDVYLRIEAAKILGVPHATDRVQNGYDRIALRQALWDRHRLVRQAARESLDSLARIRKHQWPWRWFHALRSRRWWNRSSLFVLGIAGLLGASALWPDAVHAAQAMEASTIERARGLTQMGLALLSVGVAGLFVTVLAPRLKRLKAEMLQRHASRREWFFARLSWIVLLSAVNVLAIMVAVELLMSGGWVPIGAQPLWMWLVPVVLGGVGLGWFLTTEQRWLDLGGDESTLGSIMGKPGSGPSRDSSRTVRLAYDLGMRESESLARLSALIVGRFPGARVTLTNTPGQSVEIEADPDPSGLRRFQAVNGLQALKVAAGGRLTVTLQVPPEVDARRLLNLYEWTAADPLFTEGVAEDPSGATPRQAQLNQRMADFAGEIGRAGARRPVRKPLDGPGRWIGRGIAGVLLAVLVLSGVMPALALAAKLSSPGPALFWQERVGFQGRPIVIPKFRTKTNELDEQRRQDTWFGRVFRPTVLDDLPQLWSIVKGDMQWSGPRPHQAHELPEGYVTAVLAHTRPGFSSSDAAIEGPGVGSQSVDARRMALDLEDLERWSVRHNLQVMLACLAHVVRGLLRAPSRLRRSVQTSPTGRTIRLAYLIGLPQAQHLKRLSELILQRFPDAQPRLRRTGGASVGLDQAYSVWMLKAIAKAFAGFEKEIARVATGGLFLAWRARVIAEQWLRRSARTLPAAHAAVSAAVQPWLPSQRTADLVGGSMVFLLGVAGIATGFYRGSLLMAGLAALLAGVTGFALWCGMYGQRWWVSRQSARKVLAAFDEYKSQLDRIEARAQARFDQRDWPGKLHDTEEQEELQEHAMDEPEEFLRVRLGEYDQHRSLWHAARLQYERFVARRYARSMRYQRTGNRTYPYVPGDTRELLQRILREQPFRAPFADLAHDTHVASELIEAYLSRFENELGLDRRQFKPVAVFEPTTFSRRHALVRGYLITGAQMVPLMLSFEHPDAGGIRLDANETRQLLNSARVSFLEPVDRERRETSALARAFFGDIIERASGAQARGFVDIRLLNELVRQAAYITQARLRRTFKNPDIRLEATLGGSARYLSSNDIQVIGDVDVMLMQQVVPLDRAAVEAAFLAVLEQLVATTKDARLVRVGAGRRPRLELKLPVTSHALDIDIYHLSSWREGEQNILEFLKEDLSSLAADTIAELRGAVAAAYYAREQELYARMRDRYLAVRTPEDREAFQREFGRDIARLRDLVYQEPGKLDILSRIQEPIRTMEALPEQLAQRHEEHAKVSDDVRRQQQTFPLVGVSK